MSRSADETIVGVVEPTVGAPTDRSQGSFLRPGEVFGPWKLIEHIADGGFGAVWRAAAIRPVETDRRTVRVDENAAVKFFAATTESTRSQIAREVHLAQRLGGLWTPEYFGSDLDAIPQWAAFEFITDATLRDLVRSTGPLDGQSLEVFAEDLWDALAYFRHNGVAHRDLTPANIHVHAQTAKPRVIDWGNARDASSGTHTPYLPRTAGYAAPEQVEGRATGPAADLWSWAAVVCFAATGRPPLPVDGYHKAIIACDVPLDLDGVPARILPAIDAALRWDPADRDPELIASHLPGRKAHVELEAARMREFELDEALEDLDRRMRLRDERIEELDALLERYEAERRDVVAVKTRLSRAEAERDDAARDVTALRARVAELENELDAFHTRVPQVVETAAAALRRAKREAWKQRFDARRVRLQYERLDRKVQRYRATHGKVPTPVPPAVAAVLAVLVLTVALVRAHWESSVLVAVFVVPAVAGVLASTRLTARSHDLPDQVRAGGAAALLLLPFLAPLLFAAGAVPVPSIATWIVHAPFPTPPPADALGVGHGARYVDVDPSDCVEPLPPNSYWDVLVVDCP